MTAAQQAQLRQMFAGTTSDDALSYAIECDESVRRMGSDDIARRRLVKERDAALAYAELVQ